MRSSLAQDEMYDAVDMKDVFKESTSRVGRGRIHSPRLCSLDLLLSRVSTLDCGRYWARVVKRGYWIKNKSDTEALRYGVLSFDQRDAQTKVTSMFQCPTKHACSIVGRRVVAGISWC